MNSTLIEDLGYYAVRMGIYGVSAVGGVFAGIALRKNKNKKVNS